MARVKLEQVRKVYDEDTVAVRDVSLEIDHGEFLVLVGPSGCGKSSVLRMIAGLETISGGRISIGDRVVNDLPPRDRDVAMVFQNYALYPHMTVFENMAFGLKLRKFPRDEIRERVKEAAEVLSITEILDRRPGQLSGGQRQRAAVGRALVRRPKVFLFDEPLSNLDAKLRQQMRTEIARLHRHLGATMIYVTHDQVEAMTLGDRIGVLKEGQVQQIATPMHLYGHPANRFVAGFIGSPGMNFIEGHLALRDTLSFQSMDDRLSISLAQDHQASLRTFAGRRVVLGIRPEDVSVVSGGNPAGPPAGIRFSLDMLEPMGNEVFVHARGEGVQVIARVPPQPLPPPGAAVYLAFAPERLHFFDAETGAALNAA